MRHGDLKLLFGIALVTGVLYFGIESGVIYRSATNAASTASGAIAYVWEDEDFSADPAGPYAPYEDQESYEELGYYGAPDEILYPTEVWYAEELWDGPYYWPERIPVYEDPYEPGIYYDPYYEEVAIVEEPWYVETFPGVGQTFTYLLPPIAASRPVIQPPSPPRPSCTMSASPSAVAYGGSTVISWSAQNSARAVLSGVGDVPGTGSRTFSNLASPQTYALSVSGLGGSYTCSVNVYVQQGDIVPSCQISTNPSAIRRGEAANLAWISQHAESAQLSGEGLVAQSGGRIVAPTHTTVYTLTVTSRTGRSASCATTLNVQ